MATTELPQLTDRNPDVIKYAENDRRTALSAMEEFLALKAGAADTGLIAEMVSIYREVALRHTDAGWWLNHSGRQIAPIVLREMTADDKARLAALAARR